MTTAIQRLATDEDLRAKLVQEGFKNVPRFDWLKTAEQVLSILEACA
jgi:glycosyltransferase involved in cell wall biosynthesis